MPGPRGWCSAVCYGILEQNGLADGLLRHGQQHDTCLFRSGDAQFELKYSGPGCGEVHTVYPQQDLVRDLIAEFLDRGGDLRFETAVVELNDLKSDRQAILSRSYERDHGISWLALLTSPSAG